MPDGHTTAPELDLVHGVPPNSMSYITTLPNKTGSWKYIRPLYRDRVAPCNEGCPVGIDIEAYMNLLREGRIDDAIGVLLRENPMPAVTGRVCYHPCETTCNRRRHDGEVAIHAVERLLGDEALKLDVEPAPRLFSEHVAIVGSGPAGLAAAYHLARLGYGVTIFEAAPEPGGVLRLGIPEYRLPKDVLAKEIARITALGIEIKCNARVGVDPSWDTLDAYDAVFLAMGVHKSQPLGIPGEDVAEIRPGLAFLKEVNFGGRPEIGPRVIVIGGGNTAMDCARTALRLGNDVEVLYRRTRAEMPATDEEVREAEEEGVVMQYLAAPVGVRASNGRLLGLECVRMRLGEADASGRRRPVPIDGSNFFVACDTVLTAIGEAPEFEEAPLDHDAWVIKVGEFGAAKKDGWFAGGDIIEEPHTVAHALGAGKRAAIGIDHFLRGKDTPLELSELRYGKLGNAPITRWRDDDPVDRNGAVNEVVGFEDLNLEHFTSVPRHTDRRLSIEDSKRGFAEVNRGLTWGHGLDEARRCFNCGVCNRCELCMIYCPDLAISRRADGTGFDINYDYCKGCGICNAECPRGAMVMTREGL